MSVQLSTYFRLRAAGVEVEAAADQADLLLTEARLWEQAVARGEASFPQGENEMEDVKTSIRVGDGPEVPIDLKKDISDPANAGAKEQIGGLVEKAIGTDTGRRLKLFIERIERLEEEKKALGEDVAEVFNEAKSTGFDTKTMKRILKLRKMNTQERQEAEALLSTYMDAIGMTPIEAHIALAAAA